MPLMKPSNRMQSIIEKIATKHGLDLKQPDNHLRLEFGPKSAMMPLVIEKVGIDRISVAHYYVDSEGDQRPDPDVTFWIGPDGKWYPIEIRQDVLNINGHQVGGPRVYVNFKDGKPGAFYPRLQNDLASFCNQWGTNIRWQGYLEDAKNPKEKETA